MADIHMMNLHSHRGGDDRLRPRRDIRDMAHRSDLPLHDVKHEQRRGCRTSGWIRVCAVVEESKLRQLWKQTNKIDPAVIKPLLDPVLRNIVSASRDAGTNTCHMELGCRKTDVPDSNFDPLRERSQKESRDGFASERGLKCERRALCDRFLEKALTFVPGGTVGFALRNAGDRQADAPRRLIGIEVVGAFLANGSTTDAGLPGTVGSGQHVDAG